MSWRVDPQGSYHSIMEQGNPIQHPRLVREHRTIEQMVGIFCNDHHGTAKGDTCEECAGLLEYAHRRLDACRYQEHKPTCANCPSHCYKPSMKKRVMEVMGYSGPRMMLRHPYHALMHLLDGFRKPPANP